MRVECVFCVYAVGSAGVPARKKLSVFLTQRRRGAEVWHGHLARVSWAELPMHANRCAVNVYGIQARGAPGGASVCLPADEQTLVPPILRSKTNHNSSTHTTPYGAPARALLHLTNRFKVVRHHVAVFGWGFVRRCGNRIFGVLRIADRPHVRVADPVF